MSYRMISDTGLKLTCFGITEPVIIACASTRPDHNWLDGRDPGEWYYPALDHPTGVLGFWRSGQTGVVGWDNGHYFRTPEEALEFARQHFADKPSKSPMEQALEVAEGW